MLISDVPEDAMLKIKRPVGVLANRSLHQNLMHSGCCEIAASYIHANPPGYDTNLPVSRMGRFISRIKSSFELFCVLV